MIANLCGPDSKTLQVRPDEAGRRATVACAAWSIVLHLVGKECPLMGDRANYLATMIALFSAAFGVVAALAWNVAITDLIKQLLPAGKGIVWEFIYAIIITIIAIVVMVQMGKAAERAGGKSAI
jgi:hypothetical protein